MSVENLRNVLNEIKSIYLAYFLPSYMRIQKMGYNTKSKNYDTKWTSMHDNKNLCYYKQIYLMLYRNLFYPYSPPGGPQAGLYEIALAQSGPEQVNRGQKRQRFDKL